MLRGSCCCGEVRFTLTEAPAFLAECYCSRCQKLGGSPFVMTTPANITIEAGSDAITALPPAPPFKYTREFCSRCGTSLGELRSTGEMVPIPASCFDDPLDLPLRFVEHAATKPPWVVIPEGVKVFDGDPA